MGEERALPAPRLKRKAYSSDAQVCLLAFLSQCANAMSQRLKINVLLFVEDDHNHGQQLLRPTKGRSAKLNRDLHPASTDENLPDENLTFSEDVGKKLSKGERLSNVSYALMPSHSRACRKTPSSKYMPVSSRSLSSGLEKQKMIEYAIEYAASLELNS